MDLLKRLEGERSELLKKIKHAQREVAQLVKHMAVIRNIEKGFAKGRVTGKANHDRRWAPKDIRSTKS